MPKAAMDSCPLWPPSRLSGPGTEFWLRILRRTGPVQASLPGIKLLGTGARGPTAPSTAEVKFVSPGNPACHGIRTRQADGVDWIAPVK